MADARNQAQNEDPQDQSMEEILQSIRRIIAEEGDTTAAPPPAPAPAPEADASDVLELTDVVEEVPVEIVAPPPLPQDDVLSSIDAALNGTSPAPAAAPAPAPRARAMDDERIIAPIAESASTAALQHLVQAAAKPEPVRTDTSPRFNPASTLEELTIEALRPLLKQWLDANLPPLVESIVDREVRRISRTLTDGGNN